MAFKKIVTWYERYERWVSSLSLIGGFIFDAVALKRVDLFIENFWIIVHLLMAAVGIIALNLFEKGKTNSKMSEESRSRVHFWLIIFVQFAFGGLLSTFLVFYFRSATLAESWPFLLLLVTAFAANEIFKKHYIRLSFQISIFFLSLYAFAIFLVPVLMHRIGDDIFALSGVLSVAVLIIFLLLLWLITRERFLQSRKILTWSIASIVIIINVLYFTNLIPPLPISLKDSGVYHTFVKTNAGNYDVSYEATDWHRYFELYDRFHVTAGQPVYVYTAVFAPTAFDTHIFHVWQYYNEKTKEWLTTNRIPLSVLGGRDGGFRTYSQKSAVFPGMWRVDAETTSGKLIGRVRFILEPSGDFTLATTTLN